MNRRSFLAWMILAPVAGPAALKEAAGLVAVAPRWIPIQWWEREEDYGFALGVAVAVQHSVSGEIRRNAVRIMRRQYGNLLGLAESRATARRLLRMWADEQLPA